MKKYIKWIIFTILLILFLIIGFLVLKGNDIYVDEFIYSKIDLIVNDRNTSIFKFITYLGSAYVVISLIILGFILIKNKKYSLFMSINLISITLLQFILKNIYSRGRPIDISLIEESGYSFPSGHSLTAMAFYGLLIYYIYKSNINKNKKIVLEILLSIIILLIGLSRIYLGVHYFTDVVGAFSFSICYLIIYTKIIGRWLYDMS